MTDIDDTKCRLLFATKHVLKRSVMMMQLSDWESLIREDGVPTQVNSLGKELQSVIDDAQVVAIAASGCCNPDPGIDIVRHDECDAPYVHNIDHYTVCQNLAQHSQYAQIANTAGVTNSPELQQCLSKYVFVVKQTPDETADHWTIDLPERVKNACERGTLPKP